MTGNEAKRSEESEAKNTRRRNQPSQSTSKPKGYQKIQPVNKQAKRLSHSQASPSNDECVNDKQDKTSESEKGTQGTEGRMMKEA